VGGSSVATIKFFDILSIRFGMKVRAVVVFLGRVQGVNFRAYCAEKAESLGLDGYVENRWDGSVEAVFEGDRSKIEACIEWNKTSQPHARVESVEVSWSEPNGEFHGFHVRR
jgi:acylphosphatase